jgi:hypothetical protein
MYPRKDKNILQTSRDLLQYKKFLERDPRLEYQHL